MPKILNFKTIIEQDEDGVFVASVPAIPGCHSQGDTYEKALKNVAEAMELCLEEATENKQYRSQIGWPQQSGASKFVGVVDLPMKIPFFA